MAEEFLTVEQAAARLHVHPITIRRHLRSGTLRGSKLGKLWRVPESALLESMPSPLSPVYNESPLALALALVEERDARVGPVIARRAGVNDAAADIRRIRAARTS